MSYVCVFQWEFENSLIDYFYIKVIISLMVLSIADLFSSHSLDKRWLFLCAKKINQNQKQNFLLCLAFPKVWGSIRSSPPRPSVRSRVRSDAQLSRFLYRGKGAVGSLQLQPVGHLNNNKRQTSSSQVSSHPLTNFSNKPKKQKFLTEDFLCWRAT